MNSLSSAKYQYQNANATQTAPKIALWHIIGGIILTILFTTLFVKIFDLVQDSGKGATSFDRTIQVWVHGYQVAHPAQGIVLFKIATFLALIGSPRIIVSLAVVAALVGFVWPKVRGAAWTFPIAIVGAGVIIQSVKLLIHRDRPSSFTPLIHESGYSFPSGHSLIAMVVYGLIGYFVMHLFQRHAARVIICILTALLIFSIGISRIYVFVHYPTDVLAGWTAGVPWLITCLALHEALARRWPSTGESVLRKPSAASMA